jgi:stalled ribosome alternative rescue factor ArfA
MKVMVQVTSPDQKVAKLAAKAIKSRINKDGLMGSASRVHRVKKGKGSFRRQKRVDTNSELH